MSKVQFVKRMGRSYSVLFFDISGQQLTWENGHGGPHVETPSQGLEGKVFRLSAPFFAKDSKGNECHKENTMFGVIGVSNEASSYGAHITVPSQYVRGI
jgi:hypothetical protein